MTVHNVQSNEAFREAVKNNKVLVVDWFATTSSASKELAPLLAALSNDEAFKAFHFVKADVDELSALAEEMGVKAPTLQLYREGEKTNEIIDATPDQLFPFLGGGL